MHGQNHIKKGIYSFRSVLSWYCLNEWLSDKVNRVMNRYTRMFVETMIWIARLKSAERASINVSFDDGTSLKVTAENSWILRWTFVREVYLKGSSRRVTLHFPPSFIHTLPYNVSRLFIKVNRIIVSLFLAGLTPPMDFDICYGFVRVETHFACWWIPRACFPHALLYTA